LRGDTSMTDAPRTGPTPSQLLWSISISRSSTTRLTSATCPSGMPRTERKDSTLPASGTLPRAWMPAARAHHRCAFAWILKALCAWT